MQQNYPSQDLSHAATLSTSVRFPGEDNGQSLAEMARRDLDAALQLLADRAQFITGASGAAIALRRDGMNDMQCRASAGSNAPGLGALLSTEFGLSGESVRTKRALRCDDAERDARVNREVCRQLGIASVVVMPVVHDDDVMGVFELFSGQANAFGERDLSAVKRLSEMVETAVRMAQATASLPERLGSEPAPRAEAPSVEETILDDEIFGVGSETVEASVPAETTVAPVQPPAAAAPSLSIEAQAQRAPEVPVENPAPKKPLFWSAAAAGSASETPAMTPEDQSQVPPVMRSLRKCEACGFPVSAGRALCVECEEKKWRGQLKRP